MAWGRIEGFFLGAEACDREVDGKENAHRGELAYPRCQRGCKGRDSFLGRGARMLDADGLCARRHTGSH